DGGIARQRDHGVAVATKDEGGHVLHAHFQFVGDEGAEAGGIEHPRHADDALARKSAELVGRLGHGVQRIRNDNQDAIRRVLHHLADYGLHDAVVRVDKIVAAHSGIAWNAGGDDDDVRNRGVFVIVGAGDIGV